MFGNIVVIGVCGFIVMFYNFFDKNICKILVKEKGFIDDVVLDRDGNVIFNNYFENIVKKIDMNGKMLFKYSYEELMMLYGLIVDGYGNIFVNGFVSNNIYIVLNDGKIVRILEGV